MRPAPAPAGGAAPCRLTDAPRRRQAANDPCPNPNTNPSWRQAVNRYLRLGALVRGEAPRALLQAAPRGYVAARARALAAGPCCAAFRWAGGGAWGGKPWSAELPTDSALLLYLFAAFLEARARPVQVLVLGRGSGRAAGAPGGATPGVRCASARGLRHAHARREGAVRRRGLGALGERVAGGCAKAKALLRGVSLHRCRPSMLSASTCSVARPRPALAVRARAAQSARAGRRAQAPKWHFALDELAGTAAAGVPLFVGTLPVRPPPAYAAILSFRPTSQARLPSTRALRSRRSAQRMHAQPWCSGPPCSLSRPAVRVVTLRLARHNVGAGLCLSKS